MSMITTSPRTRSPLDVLADEVLDPSPARRERARRRYEDLGGYLKRHVPTTFAHDVHVYPQGSYRLGTTNVHPVTNEFDVDLVVCLDVPKEATTQKELTQRLNGWLGSYAAQRKSDGGELCPVSFEGGKRAFTLSYGDNFHMDVLPVVPQYRFGFSGEPSWLADRMLRPWQPTNPLGFAEHFEAVSAAERRVLAERRAVNVDDLPESEVKTDLQRTVKLLKRHRDHYFGDNKDGLAPPSAVITALATGAYQSVVAKRGPGVADLADVVALMPYEMRRTTGGDPLVPNPTLAEENYADRYAGDRDKCEALISWLDAARGDLRSAILEDGVHVKARIMDRAFGAELGGRVAQRMGATVAGAAAAGTLGTSNGRLDVASHAPHRRHTFFGERS